MLQAEMGNGFRHICKRAHKSCCLGCKRNQTTEGKVSVCSPWTSGKVLSQKPISSLETVSGQTLNQKKHFHPPFFHASHSSRRSFQKSKTIFTAFWFRAAKEPPNFCLPCYNKKKHVNLVLVKFSQHTPKMPLLFSLFLACNLVFLQKGQQGWKQKHWARGDFMVKNSGFSSHERNKYLHTSAFQPQMI